jgi:DNA-binding response OmpR family regulator
MSKILLVEDDINLRDIYTARFTAENYEVITASDGEEALATAVRERPDLIILDVMMPKISGFDVLDILRSTPETKTTQVVMMTALSQESDKIRGESLGANRYLIKSQVTLEDVVNTVKEILQGDVQPNPAPQAPPAPSQPAPPAQPNSPASTPPDQQA